MAYIREHRITNLDVGTVQEHWRSTLNVVRRIPFGDQAVDRREAEIFWP